MKHDVLRAAGHNIAASLVSGFIFGQYGGLDIFGEAARSEQGCITIDFLIGTMEGARPSRVLWATVRRFHHTLPRWCASHGIAFKDFVELKASYFTPQNRLFRPYFTVTVIDSRGRRSVTEYVGYLGARPKVVNAHGRVGRKPVQRLRLD